MNKRSKTLLEYIAASANYSIKEAEGKETEAEEFLGLMDNLWSQMGQIEQRHARLICSQFNKAEKEIEESDK